MAKNAVKAKTKDEVKEDNSFQAGDLAVYPAHGVGRIESIENKDVGGSKQDFYIMKIIENNMVIMIPTKNVSSVGLRGVIKKKEIRKVYKVMQTKNENPIDGQTWNRRYREYMDKIRTGSIYDVAEVFRDLYLLKFTKNLSFGERKLLDTTKGLLLRELCIAKDKDEDQIMAEIESLFPGKN